MHLGELTLFGKACRNLRFEDRARPVKQVGAETRWCGLSFRVPIVRFVLEALRVPTSKFTRRLTLICGNLPLTPTDGLKSHSVDYKKTPQMSMKIVVSSQSTLRASRGFTVHLADGIDRLRPLCGRPAASYSKYISVQILQCQPSPRAYITSADRSAALLSRCQQVGQLGPTSPR